MSRCGEEFPEEHKRWFEKTIEPLMGVYVVAAFILVIVLVVITEYLLIHAAIVAFVQLVSLLGLLGV